MTMIFCRGCGKQIHDSAPQCPQCGALQTTSPVSKVSWMSIAAVILGGLGFLGSFDFNPNDKDQVAGIVLFTVISIALAGISLHQAKPGRSLSITAITLSAIGLLICLGSLR